MIHERMKDITDDGGGVNFHHQLPEICIAINPTNTNNFDSDDTDKWM